MKGLLCKVWTFYPILLGFKALTFSERFKSLADRNRRLLATKERNEIISSDIFFLIRQSSRNVSISVKYIKVIKKEHLLSGKFNFLKNVFFSMSLS